MTVPTDLAAQAAAARQAAERARRLVRELAQEGDRARMSRFAADLEAEADALEWAPTAPRPALRTTQPQTQMQQARKSAHDKPDD